MRQGWIALKNGDIAYVRQGSHREDWVRRLDRGGPGGHIPDFYWPREADGWLKLVASREEARAIQDTAIAQRRVDLFVVRAERGVATTEAVAEEMLLKVRRTRAAAEKAHREHVEAVRALGQAQNKLSRAKAVQDSPNTWPIKLLLLEDAE